MRQRINRTSAASALASLVLLSLWTLSALAAAERAILVDNGLQVTPADKWDMKSKPGDVLKLTEQEGCLRLDFDVDVKDKYQLGHITFNQATCRLLLKHPVTLKETETRVLFEAKGMKKDSDRAGYLQFMPLVRDERGEILIYEPYPGSHLQSGTQNWSVWTTRYFYGAEAGGATQNIFQAEGGDGNAWPDGKLSFVGFELQVRPPQFQRVQGTLFLASIDFGGMVMPYSDPYVYADALLKEKATYRLAATISDEFQGLPLREVDTVLKYDPASLRDQLQRITFPLGPDGNYWIRHQITNEAGGMVAGDTMRYEVAGRPLAADAPAKVDPRTPPALGYLRINPEHHTTGVYLAGEPLNVVVRVFPKGAEQVELTWWLVPYEYDTAIEQGAEKIPFGGAPLRDVSIGLKGEPGRDAYRLLLSVARDGQKVDAQEYVLGRKTDLSRPYAGRQGLIRGRDYVKQTSYFRTTFTPQGKARSEDEYVAQFVSYLHEASQMSPYVTYMIDVADFEMLPGVYDSTALDRIMDAAADRGCAITVRFGHVDQERPYRWLKYTRQRSYDGTEIYNHYYGNFSPVDPVYLDCWLRANRAFYDRYRTHPGFQGYYLMEPGGESTVLDKPWLGTFCGYDAPMREAFRKYLKDNKGLTLDAVNQRWGTACKSWQEVEPPLPEFRSGTKPDTRVQWLDFCRLKSHLDTAFWFQTLARDIRTYDQEHVIIVYTTILDGMEDLVDFTHGGGVPYLPGTGEQIPLWEQHRVGAIQEPHHPHRWNAYGDPNCRGWVLDWDLFTMLSIAGPGGANIHVYYFPQGSLAAHYGSEHAYDRFEKFKPIFRELHSMQVIAPPVRQVATLQDPSTLYCKHRTSFRYRLADLSRWFEVLKFAGVDYETLNKDHLKEYKLVLPNLLDEVVSRETVDTLDAYVRGGGRTLISAATGRYCPELGAEPHALLRKLGINPPAGDYVQEGDNVLAEVVEANPLFDKGAMVKFYTLTNLKNDPNRDDVRSRFFQWPYRWIPQTDYFGYYRDNKETNGKVLARFASGGVAVSQHQVGRGEVIVFWGIPEYWPEQLKDMMTRAAKWAGVEARRIDNPIPFMIEGHNKQLNRHYVILWHEKPGRCLQRVPSAPDGEWWLDELVSDCKLGTFTGVELRERGLEVVYHEDHSPLKVVRMMPAREGPGWKGNYRMPEQQTDKKK